MYAQLRNPMNNAVQAIRFKQNPIISEQPGSRIGENINGPSLIKVPSWLPNPLGLYYLYFAHHSGEYIRLAYAQNLEGPWLIHEPGTLKLKETICVHHIASPDVHVDHEKQVIRMYFHGPIGRGSRQVSLVATSADGIHFAASKEILGESYFRMFQWQGHHYAMAKAGVLYRSVDGLKDFERGINPFNLDSALYEIRHVALKLDGNTLSVFYSRIGDSPECILMSRIELNLDWNTWQASDPVTVLKPENEYEGVNFPLSRSKAGAANGGAHELRDPAIFREQGKSYLLYSAAGESGIAIAELLQPRLSIITTCKGRLAHLKQTLPRMVEQGEDVEVIVVDYACPDGTAAWVEEHYPQVRVVKITDAPAFNVSRARNSGAAIASAEWLLFIDADTLIPNDFVARIFSILNEGNFYHPHLRHPNVYGTFICTRTDFIALEGYDEVLRPWGGEDRDIYYRLQHFMNRSNPGFPGEWLTPILHSDADRLRFADTSDIVASHRANALYLMVKYDLCRLASTRQLPLETRQHLYDTIRNQVLTNAAQGHTLTTVEIDASGLPGVNMAKGWKTTRKLHYELFPEGGKTSAPVPLRAMQNRAVKVRAPGENSGRRKATGHIAMFHLGRSGSTVLGNLLNQHPLIEWDGEIYEPRGRFYHKHGFNGDAVDPLGFLGKRLAGAAKPSYAFEIKPYQMRLVKLTVEELLATLDTLGFTHFGEP